MCPRRVIVLFRKATRRHCAEDAGQMARNAGSAMREEHSGKSAQCGVAPGGKSGLHWSGALPCGLGRNNWCILCIKRIGQLHQGAVAGIADVAVCELGKP